MIDFDEDSICIYRIANANNLAKEQIGVSEDNPFII
jgi:CRISPR/Cas system-associated endoribonuclease Cas2